MRVRLHMLTMDPLIADMRDVSPVQGMLFDSDDPILDGPVGRRVAVLDFDDKGRLRQGARLAPPRKTAKYREFDWGQDKLPKRTIPKARIDRTQAYDRNALRSVSVFATVLRVLKLFEGDDAIGRRIPWAFDGEQLLVVPRAGDWANAFYERASRSLQFFHFTARRKGRQVVVETALSPDIVAHETAHAVLDGVAPDLYDALSPQSLAIHEAVADLTAIFFTLELSDLRRHLLEQSGGDLRQPTELGWIAEEFGEALAADGGGSHLRTIYSETRLEEARPEPHDLSVVLSSAIFDAMLREYERALEAGETGICTPDGPEDDAGESTGHSLWRASWLTRRILYRALDYLPPGESSFADLGRAMIAADRAAYPDPADGHWRDGLTEAFLKRGIVRHRDELEPAAFDAAALSSADLQELLASDWYAYRLVEERRRSFGVPADAAFEVRPRLLTEKSYYRDGARVRERELILKITWWVTEANDALAAAAQTRRIRRGATVVVAIDAPGQPIKLLLSNDPAERPELGAVDADRAGRDAFLRLLAASGRLMSAEGGDPDEIRRMGLVPAEVIGGVLRIHELGAMLHLIGADMGHNHGDHR